MGILEGLVNTVTNIFVAQSPSKDQKNATTVKNAKAVKEDRWSAIEYFGYHPDVEATAKGLLPRFDYSLEHGILDTREKELAMKHLVRFKDAALPFVVEHLKNSTRIAWPIKILRAVSNDQAVLESLISALNYDETSFDQSQTDKNYDILCHLIDFKRPEIAQKIPHFLKDPDERVRFAAAEVLLEQDYSPEVKVALEPFLNDPAQDNSRIRESIMRSMTERGLIKQENGVFNLN